MQLLVPDQARRPEALAHGLGWSHLGLLSRAHPAGARGRCLVTSMPLLRPSKAPRAWDPPRCAEGLSASHHHLGSLHRSV